MKSLLVAENYTDSFESWNAKEGKARFKGETGCKREISEPFHKQQGRNAVSPYLINPKAGFAVRNMLGPHANDEYAECCMKHEVMQILWVKGFRVVS